MKKIVALAFGICLMGGAVSAQTLDSKYGLDSVKTLENASIYSEFLKQKNYKEALPAWRYVFNNAPKFQMLTYTKGEDLLINIYQQTKDKTYVDTLMMLYDQWAKYFGDHQRYGEGYILGKKGSNRCSNTSRGKKSIFNRRTNSSCNWCRIRHCKTLWKYDCGYWRRNNRYSCNFSWRIC